MRIDVGFGRQAPVAFKRRVRDAFVTRGLQIDTEGRSAVKSDLLSGLRLDLAFILGATVGGVIYDAERAALRRAFAAARSVWAASGTIVVGEPTREPTIYLVPDGPEGDRALAACDEDYEVAPPGIRSWLSGFGWIAEADIIRIMASVRPGLSAEQYREAIAELARQEFGR